VPRPRLKAALGVLAVEAVVLLVGGIVSGHWRWIILLVLLGACIVGDWVLVRRRSSEWEANPRAAYSFMALALGMAVPTLAQLWTWLSSLWS
jgi:hypothetical protein